MNRHLLLFLALIFSFAYSANAQTQKFSSVYTDLKTQCKDKFKSKPVPENQDMPQICKGYGGYKVLVSYSAAHEIYSAVKGDISIQLVQHRIGALPAKRIEWRLANGQPFAVIMRINKYEIDPSDAGNDSGKKIGSALVVKGLAGYEHIDLEVDAASPKANKTARQKADSNMTKPKAK